jgi:hypothetical protein
MADMTSNLNMVNHKLTGKQKNNCVVFTRCTFTSAKPLSLFLTDIQKRSVDGISDLKAISRAKRFHNYLKLNTH